MQTFPCKALLFDMDGTLIDSMDFAVHLYASWARSRDLDPDHVVAVMPGLKTDEVVRRVAPHLDAEKERDAMLRRELTDMTGVRSFPGADVLMRSLRPHQWAIVTSAVKAGAQARLDHLGIVPPPVFVTGELVTHGKPAPDCFLLAAHKLGLAPEDCIVMEDAPSGIAAGKAAGMRVIAVATTHALEELAQADAIIRTIADLGIEQREGGIEVVVEEV